jgi:hypothetical protein
MKNTLHTPAPWKHDPTWGIIKHGKTEICALHSGNLANARLIAAAPDLLDALDWALRQIEDDLDPDHQAAFDAALSTLRKAKGEV